MFLVLWTLKACDLFGFLLSDPMHNGEIFLSQRQSLTYHVPY